MSVIGGCQVSLTGSSESGLITVATLGEYWKAEKSSELPSPTPRMRSQVRFAVVMRRVASARDVSNCSTSRSR